MILVVVLLAVTLVNVSAALAACTGPGKARWPIKTSLPAEAEVNAPKAGQLEDLLNLAEPPGVTKNDKRYQSARIPKFPNSLDVQEGDIISTVGWLHLVATENNDCDYHIQISNSPTDGNDCLIVEIPKNDENFVASPELRELAATARKFIRDELLKGREPSSHGNVMQHPPCLKITGQLFFDDPHVKDKPRGRKKMKAKTLWEIHPVTDIEFAPPPNP